MALMQYLAIILFAFQGSLGVMREIELRHPNVLE
jgi:hypothetical protein